MSETVLVILNGYRLKHSLREQDDYLAVNI